MQIYLVLSSPSVGWWVFFCIYTTGLSLNGLQTSERRVSAYILLVGLYSFVVTLGKEHVL